MSDVGGTSPRRCGCRSRRGPLGPATAADGRSAEELIAEYDEERPAGRLSCRLDAAVTAWCVLTALFVIRQVFDPQSEGKQFYLSLFLTSVLPLVFVTNRKEPTDGCLGDGTVP